MFFIRRFVDSGQRSVLVTGQSVTKLVDPAAFIFDAIILSGDERQHAHENDHDGVVES